MSTAILAALRTKKQLHGNTLLVAIELAHQLNPQGFGSVAYTFLALKAHCCTRTAISQIDRLIHTHHLFRKTVIRTKYGNARNLYQYIGPRLSHPFPPATTQGATVARILPTPRQEREEKRSLAEDIKAEQQKIADQWAGLRATGSAPGSFGYQCALEYIARCEARLAALETLRHPSTLP